jgi:survival-of-motor-neuron-related-splicing factor 30
VQAGFLSTGKKGSIFSVPENPQAKVGVVGSGQGMTDYKMSNRHDFAAD